MQASKQNTTSSYLCTFYNSYRFLAVMMRLWQWWIFPEPCKKLVKSKLCHRYLPVLIGLGGYNKVYPNRMALKTEMQELMVPEAGRRRWRHQPGWFLQRVWGRNSPRPLLQLLLVCCNLWHPSAYRNIIPIFAFTLHGVVPMCLSMYKLSLCIRSFWIEGLLYSSVTFY